MKKSYAANKCARPEVAIANNVRLLFSVAAAICFNVITADYVSSGRSFSASTTSVSSYSRARGYARSEHTTFNEWNQVVPTKGNKPSQRLGHTAVVSTFGNFKDRVMIVYGGVDTFLPSQEGALSSHWYGEVWLYSLQSNSWFNMTDAGFSPRAYHSAVVIDTEMIVFGGLNLNNTLNDTWHFSLADGMWRHGGYSPGHRFLHAAVSVADEKMLMFFGKQYPQITGNKGLCYDDVWEYEPRSHTWTLLTPTPDPVYGKPLGRSGHTAVYFKGTQIVLILGGGQCNLSSPMNDLWEYNVKSNSWHQRRAMTYHIMDHVSVSLIDILKYEIMFVFGGELTGNGAQDSEGMFLYDVGKDVWRDVIPVDFRTIPSRRIHPSAVMMTFVLFLFGGQDSITSMPLDDVWEMYMYSFDTDLTLWQKVGPPDVGPPPRSGASLVSLDQYAVLFGGYDGFMLSDLYTWVYHGHTGVWSEINLIGPMQRVCHAAAVLSADSVVISGGFSFSDTDLHDQTVTSLRDLSIFDMKSFSWVELDVFRNEDGEPMPRGNHVLFKSSSGDIHMHGGLFVETSGNNYQVLDDHWIVYKDGGLLYWKKVSCHSLPCPSARAGHSAVTLRDGRVIVYGGMTNLSKSIDELWDYSITSNTWTHIHTLGDRHPPASAYHSTAVYGYKMFLHGGCKTPSFERPFRLHFLDCTDTVDGDKVWMYDGTEQLWSVLDMANDPKERYGHCSAILSVSDRPVLLLFGGFELARNTEGALIRPDGNSYVATLGCNAGDFSRNFATKSCNACLNGSYATHPGQRKCHDCPTGTTTVSGGSINQSLCSVCSPEVTCHGHGSCLVLANSDVECQCTFAYDSKSKCKQVQRSVVLFGAIVLLSVAVLVVAILLVYRHRQYKRRQMEAFRTIQLSQKAIDDLQGAFQIDSSEISFRERVDHDSPGSFGEVWLAEYRDLPVAVKKLKRRLIEPTFERHFAREIEFMKTIRHANIVLFIGVGYVSPNNQAILVTEYLRRGALSTILQDRSSSIEHSQKLRFCSDAAKGMRFLHNLDPPRIHRDLKCDNLLVSDRWIVKVADFGTARLIRQLDEPQDVDKEPESIAPHRADMERKPLLEAQKLMSESVGTLLWRAPETFFERKYGAAVDVYR